MAGFVGMDPVALRGLVDRLLTQADEVEASIGAVTSIVTEAQSFWEGDDFDGFNRWWVSHYRVRLEAARDAVAALAAGLARNIDEQEAASSAGTGIAGLAGLGGAAALLASAARPPGPSHGPARNAGWWRGLSAAQRQWVVARHPEWIGNLDGIPASARSAANMALLPRYRAELEAERAALVSQHGARADVSVIDGKLHGLDSVEIVMGRGDRQLVVLDTTGGEQLKAAVAIGDLDTADHIAVFTPGFTTTVAGAIGSTDSKLLDLKGDAEAEVRRTGSGSVAVVSWLGYEAPQVGDLLEWNDNVANDALAREGGQDLARFYDGLDEMRGADAHVTALGHSYGSTTTGFALQHASGVDDAVFFGSPGLGVSDLRDLDVDQGHVFYLEARDDVVGDLGRFGADPSSLDGVTQLGTSPTRTPDGAALGGSTGHSQYFLPDSTSQHNIAAVVAGNQDRLVLDTGGDAGLVDSGARTAVETARGVDRWVGERADDAREAAERLGDQAGDAWNDLWRRRP